MAETGGVLTRLRQPEYTGENRCVQCTVVNAAIAIVLSAVVAFVGLRLASPAVGAGAAVVVLVVSAASIYLRGYLVPGTPELTKRYFPDRVLGWFGKAPETAAGIAPEAADPDEEIDPERTLMAVGALEECQGGEELCLTDAFRADWYAEIDRLEAADADRDRLLSVLDLTAAEVEFREFGDAFAARIDGRRAGTWESRAAFLADLGVAGVLADRLQGWGELSVSGRSQLMNGLRLFIDQCPSCGGTPTFGTETVESCCSTHDVAAVECDGCGARLFESQPI